MVTLGFKNDSGATLTNIDAVDVRLGYHENKVEYTDINDVLRKIVKGVYKEFTVKFGRLSKTQRDYLSLYETEEAPQFIYDAVTYDVLVISLNSRVKGGTITVRKTAKET